MKIKTTLILVFFFVVTYGQSESNNWYFGFGAGVHFNVDGSVNPLTDGQLNTYEGCASISSTTGELLFYTDGTSVYDRNHSVMPNGNGLAGNPSSVQSSIIIPKPKSLNGYYIVTTNAQYSSPIATGLNYSEVDMSLNNGNGAVVSKNINLLNQCAEKVVAVVKDCKQNSFWIIAFGSETNGPRPFNTFHAFELNSSGIQPNSISSKFRDIEFGGYLKLSLDGTKLASANMSSGLFLYDFNPATGTVTNEQEIIISAPEDNNAYGIEFSPNGNYLYVHASNDSPFLTGHTSSLFQYNLWAPDISASQITLDYSRDLYRAALQLGPNGKIYRALTETYEIGTPFLGVINNPDELGLATNYEHNAVPLDGRLAAQGLPPLVQSFLAKIELSSEEIILTKNDLEICVGDELNLEATYLPGALYVWEEDGNVISGETTNTLIVPKATIADMGVYKVTAYRPGLEACPLEVEGGVVVHPLPEVSPFVLTVCDDIVEGFFDGYAEFNLKQIETDGNMIYSYYASIQDMNDNLPISTPEQYINIEPYNQYVYYKVVNSNGCENIDKIELQVAEASVVLLESSYVVCTDNPELILEAPAGFDSFFWYKIDNNREELISSFSRIEISEIGNYRLMVGNVYSNNEESIICERSTDFEVIPSNKAVIEDVIISDNNEMAIIEIYAHGDGDYEYSINGIDYQDSNYFENVPSGLITVYVKDRNGCSITEQNIKVESDLWANNFPKFFTPNGDGVNDLWQYIPDPTGDINVLSIEIFNRTGQLLIQLNANSKGWDGSFNGSMLPATDYWFKASFMNQQIKHGHFSLIR